MLNIIRSMTRAQKTRFFVAIDCAMVPLALLLTFVLQMAPLTQWPDAPFFFLVLPVLMFAAGWLSVSLNLSTGMLIDYDFGSVAQTALCSLCLTAFAAAISLFFFEFLAPQGLVFFGANYFLLLVLSRAVLLKVVRTVYEHGSTVCRVIVYGAGTTGMQLVSALINHREIKPMAFIDDNKSLQGQKLLRLPVYGSARIGEVAKRYNAKRVLLAMPSLSRPKQLQLARRLQNLGLEVQTVPSFSQLIGNEALVDTLTTIGANQFLGRKEVTGDTEALHVAYNGKNVLVSGAGGSIGSELCRQIVECKPATLVIYELSELALYKIHAELQLLAEDTEIDIVPVLGSITDPRQVRRVLSLHNVDTVLHAAAYKHVPLVEANPLSGLANNVLGTHTLISEAEAAGVARFMLISSDKAVRPANIMGASKRLAELVVQDIAVRRAAAKGMAYSIVRFGNVLGSSGSVIPLFQSQLRKGGPLTVTHPDVERYFMTVQEAVNLVLQATSTAEGGETFVLDMGKPVKIETLARQIIDSAGYTVRDKNNPNGDIEIEFIGLRPGEKMSEELTTSGRLSGTKHRKIFRTEETTLSEIEMASILRSLRQAVVNTDDEAARSVVLNWVSGFQKQVSSLDAAPRDRA